MQNVQHIIDHITKVYGFIIVPLSIPRDEFQYFKRDLYIFIKNKISNRLFYLLRDRLSPIKYMIERPSGEIWFNKRINSGLIEVKLEKIPPEAAIYANDTKGSFKPINGDGNYKVTIYYTTGKLIEFPVNTISVIDDNFRDLPELKQILREFKLNNLLDE